MFIVRREAKKNGVFALVRKGQKLTLLRKKNARIAVSLTRFALGYRSKRKKKKTGTWEGHQYFNHPCLHALACLIALNGINPAVARRLEWLYSYLSQENPHGFLRHIRSTTISCWRLSREQHNAMRT
jgi:hypothetical protein